MTVNVRTQIPISKALARADALDHRLDVDCNGPDVESSDEIDVVESRERDSDHHNAEEDEGVRLALAREERAVLLQVGAVVEIVPDEITLLVCRREKHASAARRSRAGCEQWNRRRTALWPLSTLSPFQLLHLQSTVSIDVCKPAAGCDRCS